MNTVISKDGTPIGYTQVGHGPGLIQVQGALGTAHNYRDLAQALSSDFTVYTPDRLQRQPGPGRPNCLPLARALRKPALTRSWRSDRSNSAIAPIIWSISRSRLLSSVFCLTYYLGQNFAMRSINRNDNPRSIRLIF